MKTVRGHGIEQAAGLISIVKRAWTEGEVQVSQEDCLKLMGSREEAIQYLGHHNLVVDFNAPGGVLIQAPERRPNLKRIGEE
jgi:hypothetical protein